MTTIDENIIINTTKAISRKDLADLLIAAFESPVGGWCYIAETNGYIKPKEPCPADLAEYEKWPYAWYPLVKGGEVKIVEHVVVRDGVEIAKGYAHPTLGTKFVSREGTIITGKHYKPTPCQQTCKVPPWMDCDCTRGPNA